MKKRKKSVDKKKVIITVETRLKDIVILMISILFLSLFITQSFVPEQLLYSLFFYIVALTFIIYFMIRLSEYK